MTRKLRIGISACLLGQEVRFDGGHKRNAFLVDILGELVEYHDVCPEYEIGLGIPRPSLQLRGKPDDPRIIESKSEADHTEAMAGFSEKKVEEIEQLRLDGFILKKDSPSCGLFRVRVYNEHGIPSRDSRGIFAAALARSFPQLPMEEEGRLHDPPLRENFFERVYAYSRLQDFFEKRWTVGQLSDFHAREKFLLLAHEEEGYRHLGRWVAEAKGKDPEEVRREYVSRYMEVLSVIATPRKHRNVLQHLMGFLKTFLTPEQKQEILGLLDDFTEGLIPLVAPLTLLAHHARTHEVEYLVNQSYLNPHSKLLKLRNYVR